MLIAYCACKFYSDLWRDKSSLEPDSNLLRGVTEGETQNPFGTDSFVVQGGARGLCTTAHACHPLAPLQIDGMIWVSYRKNLHVKCVVFSFSPLCHQRVVVEAGCARARDLRRRAAQESRQAFGDHSHSGFMAHGAQ